MGGKIQIVECDPTVVSSTSRTPMEVSEQLLIDALRAVQAENVGDVEGLTTLELSEILGMPQVKIRALLRKLQNSGNLRVGRKWIRRIDGVDAATPCYWLKEEENV